jgi:hypothetical protein
VKNKTIKGDIYQCNRMLKYSIITTLFKHRDTQIALITNNTIQYLLRIKTTAITTYCSAGIYKLSCLICQRVHADQTGRQLWVRYKDYIRNTGISVKGDDSQFALDILNNKHSLGSIEKTGTEIGHNKKAGES